MHQDAPLHSLELLQSLILSGTPVSVLRSGGAGSAGGQREARLALLREGAHGCAVDCSHACTTDTSGGWVQAAQRAPHSCRGWARSAQGALLLLALPAACMPRASNVHALPWPN